MSCARSTRRTGVIRRWPAPVWRGSPATADPPAARSCASRTASRSRRTVAAHLRHRQPPHPRAVDLATGVIETMGHRRAAADTGRRAAGGTPLDGPRTMALDRRRRSTWRCGRATRSIASRRARTLHHVAGTGEQGYSGDGGRRARRARRAEGAGATAAGTLRRRHREPRRSADRSRTPASSPPSSAPARAATARSDPLQCRLSRPHGVFADATARLVGDSEAHRIRAWRG